MADIVDPDGEMIRLDISKMYQKESKLEWVNQGIPPETDCNKWEFFLKNVQFEVPRKLQNKHKLGLWKSTPEVTVHDRWENSPIYKIKNHPLTSQTTSS